MTSRSGSIRVYVTMCSIFPVLEFELPPELLQCSLLWRALSTKQVSKGKHSRYHQLQHDFHLPAAGWNLCKLIVLGWLSSRTCQCTAEIRRF